jgi:hypothetical protein
MSAKPEGVLKSLTSVLLERYRFFRQAGVSFGGARDLYAVLGYQRILQYLDYRLRYQRGGIAKRIVEAYPKATWRGGVELYEDEDAAKDTAFEEAWKSIQDRLNVWSRLQAADILAGLSTFSVLLIGAPGELETELPRGTSPDRLLYLQPYSGGGGPPTSNTLLMQNHTQGLDSDCSIKNFDVDPKSVRFGEPLTYLLRRTDINLPGQMREIHWSRVIHVAEGCLDDNVYGMPTLENVWNLLDDLDKVTGGGAEAFWLRANQGLHLDVDKDMGLPGSTSAGLSADERKVLHEKAEEIQHQLQRVLVTRGVTATQLGSDVANLGPNADAILKQIGGSKGIPTRILTGSEMGQLASGQDADNWRTQVQDRRTSYAGPMIVRRLVDRLVEYGYLPKPKQYDIAWPVEEDMSELDKATLALTLTNVNKNYGSDVFDADFIREKAYKLEPLEELPQWEFMSELDKATLATKLAMVNKEMGITVYTDDEIRDMSFGKAPLTDAEKVPIGAPERISVTQPPELGADGQPIPQPALPNTPEIKAALRALEEAIEADDAEAILKILGDVPGHEFHGNQWTEGGATGMIFKEYATTGYGPGERGAEKARAAAQEAHKALTKAGFVKAAPTEHKHIAGEKMGRSQAYYSSSKKSTTEYAHPDGRKASLQATYEKTSNSSVRVKHS